MPPICLDYILKQEDVPFSDSEVPAQNVSESLTRTSCNRASTEFRTYSSTSSNHLNDKPEVSKLNQNKQEQNASEEIKKLMPSLNDSKLISDVYIICSLAMVVKTSFKDLAVKRTPSSESRQKKSLSINGKWKSIKIHTKLEPFYAMLLVESERDKTLGNFLNGISQLVWYLHHLNQFLNLMESVRGNLSFKSEEEKLNSLKKGLTFWKQPLDQTLKLLYSSDWLKVVKEWLMVLMIPFILFYRDSSSSDFEKSLKSFDLMQSLGYLERSDKSLKEVPPLRTVDQSLKLNDCKQSVGLRDEQQNLDCKQSIEKFEQSQNLDSKQHIGTMQQAQKLVDCRESNITQEQSLKTETEKKLTLEYWEQWLNSSYESWEQSQNSLDAEPSPKSLDADITLEQSLKTETAEKLTLEYWEQWLNSSYESWEQSKNSLDAERSVKSLDAEPSPRSLDAEPLPRSLEHLKSALLNCKSIWDDVSQNSVQEDRAYGDGYIRPDSNIWWFDNSTPFDPHCFVCKEDITKKSKDVGKYGLLLNCLHVFCFDCILNHYLSSKSDVSNVNCIQCGKSSLGVLQSYKWLTNSKEKTDLYMAYSAESGCKGGNTLYKRYTISQSVRA